MSEGFNVRERDLFTTRRLFADTTVMLAAMVLRMAPGLGWQKVFETFDGFEGFTRAFRAIAAALARTSQRDRSV